MSRWERLAYVNRIYRDSVMPSPYQQARQTLEAAEAEGLRRAAAVTQQLRAEAAEAGKSEAEAIPVPSKEFFLAGKAAFTVEIPTTFTEQHGTKKQYTYKIHRTEPNEKFPNPAYFVSLLTGPDNQSDYSYIGKLDPNNGRVWTTAKSTIGQDSMPVKLLNRVLLNVWTNTPGLISAAGFAVMHMNRCGKCGRPLTDAVSIRTGMGAKCRGEA